MHTAARIFTNRPTQWLLAVLLAGVVVTSVAVSGLIVVRGESPAFAFSATSTSFAGSLFGPSRSADSWEPMLLAYTGTTLEPPRSLYAPFFEDGIKFQYPPTSLLPLTLVPAHHRELHPSSTPLGVSPGRTFQSAVGTLSLIFTWATIGLSILIFEWTLRQSGIGTGGAGSAAVRIGLAVVVGMTFYPLVRGHDLGQVQVYLTTLVAAGILSSLTGYRRLAGICFGVCCLFKPQYGFLLVWAVARRRWQEARSMAVTLATAGVVSVVVFGWAPHVEYLEVLRSIGSLGESYWANQSVNGLLNRLLYNGDPSNWSARDYAPYLRIVHMGTLLTSAALLLVSIVPGRRHSTTSETADLLVVLMVATMASPVAWEHHYGILLPVLAAGVPLMMQSAPFGRWTGTLLLAGVVATAHVVLRPHEFFVNRWAGLTASHLFFGAILILVGLLITRSWPRTQAD